MTFKEFIVGLMEQYGIFDQYCPDRIRVTDAHMDKELLESVQINSITYSEDQRTAYVDLTHIPKVPANMISVTLSLDEESDDQR